MSKSDRLRVMVVDDVSAYRGELIGILKSIGINYIDEAENGLKAWDKIVLESKGNEKFDLVISDINMPILNGLELLKNIREFNRTSKLSVVLVSTENEKELIMQAISMGISDYLIKPYQEETVKNRIIACLNKIIS